jgi:hypothetical protein
MACRSFPRRFRPDCFPAALPLLGWSDAGERNVRARPDGMGIEPPEAEMSFSVAVKKPNRYFI